MMTMITVDTTTEIGHGGFGTVYAGVRKDCTIKGKHFSEMQVAVKHPKDPIVAHEERAAFMNEIDVMSRVEHPACLGLIAFSIENPGNGIYSIVTERMDNNLQNVIDQSVKGCAPVGWDATTKTIVAYGVACGLAYLHSTRKIIHRDLKPGNVFLDSDYYPRVADFGLSKIISPEKQMQMTMDIGTPAYMAPELHTDEGGVYGFAVDVFAYGMMLWAVLADAEPFPGITNKFTIAQKIIQGERPMIPPFVSASSRKLIEACWDGNPSARPTFADIVKQPEALIVDGCDENAFANYRTDCLKIT
jgi:serine/threonine protein kinase